MGLYQCGMIFLACNESCFGLMECTGVDFADCCNVVDENATCALSCTHPQIQGSDFNCGMIVVESVQF